MSSTTDNNNTNNNNNSNSNRMSSELKAIMQLRLAKCEEVPVDEKMQDERQNQQQQNQQQQKVQSFQRYVHTNTSSTTTSLSPSPTTTKKLMKTGPTTTTMTTTTTPSSLSSASSTSSFYPNIGSSFSYGGGITPSATAATGGGGGGVSPFQIQNSGTTHTNSGNGNFRKSPKQFTFPSTKHDDHGNNKKTMEEEHDEMPKSTNDTNDTNATTSIIGNRIQQHPYLKRYSPTNIGGAAAAAAVAGGRKTETEKDLHVVIPKSLGSSSSSGSSLLGRRTGVAGNTNTSTTALPSVSKYQFKSLDHDPNPSNVYNSKASSPIVQNYIKRISSSSSPPSNNVLSSPNKVEKGITSSSSSSSPPPPPPPTSSLSIPAHTTTTTTTTNPTTATLSHERISSPLSPGLSASHVTAMKKLFTKTNPQREQSQQHHQRYHHRQTPPPPPPGPPPPSTSSKMSSPIHKHSTSSRTHDYQSSSVPSPPKQHIRQSSSSLSKEGIEITIDHFYKSTTTKDQNHNLNEEEEDLEGVSVDKVRVDVEQVVQQEQPQSIENDFFPSSTTTTTTFTKKDELFESSSNQNNTNIDEVLLFSGPSDEEGPSSIPIDATITTTVTTTTNNQDAFESFPDWPSNFPPPPPSSSMNHQERTNILNDNMMFEQTFSTMGKEDSNWDWPTTSNTSTNGNDIQSMDFFKNDQFTSIVEDCEYSHGNDENNKVNHLSDDDNMLIIDDEFENEPEIMNPDCVENEIVFKSFPIVKSSLSSSLSCKTVRIGAVKNPLTNNIIICRLKGGDSSSHRSSSRQSWYIDEIDPFTSDLVASTQISTNDIRQKMLSSTMNSPSLMKQIKGQIINGIENVLNIAVGLHRQQNRTRVRVAALIELSVLQRQHQIHDNGPICIVAIWQWGYASSCNSIMLQNVISSPPKGSFDAKTLSIADGLVFLAGTMVPSQNTTTTAPVVYIAKPPVRDSWTQHGLIVSGKSNNEGTKVVAMALTVHPHREFKLLAIGFNDGAVGIWSYEKAAVTNQTDKGKHQLQLLCTLEGFYKVNDIEPTINFSDDDNCNDGNENDEANQRDYRGKMICCFDL